jgi:hypothetical protein
MLRKFMVYTFGTIVVYLAVANATGGGQIIGALSQGYASGVKVLQGRG